MPLERYLERCELKTARLFEAACALGERTAGAVPSLGAFGRRIGLAFQLLDDVLDVQGPAERTGKHRGTDLLDGTITLPFILARRATASSRRSTRAPSPRREASASATRSPRRGALEDARGRALEMVERAKSELPVGCRGAAAGTRAGGRRRRRPLRVNAASGLSGRPKSSGRRASQRSASTKRSISASMLAVTSCLRSRTTGLGAAVELLVEALDGGLVETPVPVHSQLGQRRTTSQWVDPASSHSTG